MPTSVILRCILLCVCGSRLMLRNRAEIFATVYTVHNFVWIFRNMLLKMRTESKLFLNLPKLNNIFPKNLSWCTFFLSVQEFLSGILKRYIPFRYLCKYMNHTHFLVDYIASGERRGKDLEQNYTIQYIYVYICIYMYIVT